MTKRLLIGLCAALLPACMTVDTPATGDDDDEQLSSERALTRTMNDWCDATCARFASCEERCDCEGDTCTCTGIDADCPDSCRDALDEYLGHGDECADAGRMLMRCVDGVTDCEDLYAGVDCEPPASATATCNGDSGGDVGAPTGARGVTCNAGSGSGSAGAAGSANVSAFRCEELREDCSDGARYQVVCADAGEGAACNCFRSGEFDGSFTLTPARCPSTAELNDACGWLLAEDF
jgi:hypothetical protein